MRDAGPFVAGRPGTAEAAEVGWRVVAATDTRLNAVPVARLAAAAPRLPRPPATVHCGQLDSQPGVGFTEREIQTDRQ